MKTYRVYFNRIEEFYIDLEAKNKKQVKDLWDRNDLQEEEETGNSDTVITDIEELETPQETLERLRKAIRNENISYGEIAELESLKRYIKEDDVELLQWITNEK